MFQVWEASSAALDAAAATQAAQETASAPAGAAGHPGPPTAPDSSITDRVQDLLQPIKVCESPSVPPKDSTVWMTEFY